MLKGNNTIVMIGNPDSSLFVELAKEYKFCCEKILLISRYRGTQTNYKDDKVSFISSYENEKLLFRLFLSVLARILIVLNSLNSLFSKSKSNISLVEPIIQGLSVSRYVNKFKDVDFVVAHNIFTYGLACLWCKNTIRVMRPWGGDVYQHAKASKWHFSLTKHVLTNADLVDAISPAVFKYLKSTFGLSDNIVLNESSSYVGAEEVIELKKTSDKQKMRIELGFPTDKTILINSRRFKEKWGSEEVFTSFVLLAQKHHDLYFVLFSGEGSEELIAQKNNILIEKGLGDRFFLFEKSVDLQTYVKAMFSSDIFFSLMHEADLRSFSIMTGLHCDSLPVISDQPEYHEMINEGAMLQIVQYNNYETVVAACEKYLFDKQFVNQTLQTNQKFIEEKIKTNETNLPLLDKILKLKQMN